MSAPAAAPPHDDDPQRIQRAMTAWRRRSQLIRFWRLALPGMIVALLLVLVGWTAVRTFADVRADQGGADRVLLNPRFYGQDSRGRSFTVGGAEAVRSKQGRACFDLRRPLLELTDVGGDPVRVDALNGVYCEGRNLVDLIGNVRVTEPASGFTFNTGAAVADLATGVITGRGRIQGRGPLGQVSASSYSIQDEGARIVFKGDGTLEGRARMRIETRRR